MVLMWQFADQMALASESIDIAGKPNYQAPAAAARYAAKELLVKFKNVATSSTANEVAEARVMASLSAGAKAALSKIEGVVVKVHPVAGVLKVKISEKATVGDAIESLYRSDAVVYAEPNYKFKALATYPDDATFGDQWGLDNQDDTDIDAVEAWDIAQDAKKTLVCVVDTGVDYLHEDLASNMWVNPAEVAGDGIDNDNNGWIDDVHGIQTVLDYACDPNTGECQDLPPDGDPMDSNGHGTHCAGIIGAAGNNGVGVSGVAWKAQIMALKFLDAGGSGYADDAITAMEYALAVKARDGWSKMVWSNSWGGGGYSQALYDVIAKARDQGVIFVAASGNSHVDTDKSPMYPAAYDLANIISVGASDRLDAPCPSFSNYGARSVDVFAPGDAILSTYWSGSPDYKYEYLSGTSMACPHVSGACALAWSIRDSVDWKQIKGMILNGAEDGQANKGYAGKCVAGGRLNLSNSLQEDVKDDPAIFSVFPNKALSNETIVISGVGFGTQGEIEYAGFHFPSQNITGWTDNLIVATMPDGIPRGCGKLTVTNANGTARGTSFCCAMARETLVGRLYIPRGWAASTQMGNDVWVLGGEADWGVTAMVEKYSLKTNKSEIKPAWMMPMPVTNAAAAAIRKKIYVVGGYFPNSGHSTDTLQIFTPESGTWTLGASLPHKLFQAAVVPYGGKLYVFGGLDENFNTLSTTYVYDPAGDKWSSGAKMPAATSFAAATDSGQRKKLRVLGGFSEPYFGSELDLVYEYDIAKDTWTEKASMSKPRGGFGIVREGVNIYALHGSGEGTYYEDVDLWDGLSWNDVIIGGEELYTPANGKTSDGKIYTLGGSSMNGYSSNVWKFANPERVR
jgi:subtilisin family serine protease